MIQSLLIENFRGFESLKIEPLKGINLIAGENSTGKTAILEAIYLLFFRETGQLENLPSIFRARQDDYISFWPFLPPEGELTSGGQPVSSAVRARDDGQQTLTCRIQVQANQTVTVSHSAQGRHPATAFIIKPGYGEGGFNPAERRFLVFSGRVSDPRQDAEIYNQASLPDGNEQLILEFMKVLEPRLQRLRYAKVRGAAEPTLYAYVGLKNPIPVTQAGQGFCKLLTLFCAMLMSKAQVLLIDELENGLYYSILPQIWRGIAALAESEVIQVFATTHSRECIVAAHEAMKETGKYNFALHRLQRVKNRIEAITLDQEKIEVAVKSGLEVR